MEVRNALIIGCGAAGSIHAKELSSRGIDIYCSDIDNDKAAALAEVVGGRPTSRGGEYDLAVVSTIPPHHIEIAKEEMVRCGAVVVEKPLDIDPHRADDFAEFISASGLKCYIAESQAYGNGILRLKKEIDDGVFGRPCIFRACYMTKYRPQEWVSDINIGGGAFLEGGVHIMTVARVLFGNAVRWQGSTRSFLGGAPDSGTFVIDYVGGDQLLLQIGWGTEGCFTGDCDPVIAPLGIFGPKIARSLSISDNHTAMWDKLLHYISTGYTPLCTLKHAAGAVKDWSNCLSC